MLIFVINVINNWVINECISMYNIKLCFVYRAVIIGLLVRLYVQIIISSGYLSKRIYHIQIYGLFMIELDQGILTKQIGDNVHLISPECV